VIAVEAVEAVGSTPGVAEVEEGRALGFDSEVLVARRLCARPGKEEGYQSP
jgi:hypothetical protein